MCRRTRSLLEGNPIQMKAEITFEGCSRIGNTVETLDAVLRQNLGHVGGTHVIFL
jgi:hypothetical protein